MLLLFDYYDIVIKLVGVLRVLNYQYFFDVEKSKDIIMGVMIMLFFFQCFILSNFIKILINSDI